MSCGCSYQKPTQGQTFHAEAKQTTFVTKVKVICPTCKGGLVADDGMTYPAHLVPVLVPTTQYDRWLEQGHPVEIYAEPE